MQQYPILKDKIYEIIDKNTSLDIAYSYKDQTLTYQDVYNKSNNIAKYIQNTYNKSEKSIIVSIDRSVSIPLLILGIWKSGNVYVPIMTDCPKVRVDFIIQNTDSDFVITNKKYDDKFNMCQTVIYIEDLYNDINLSTNLSTNKGRFMSLLITIFMKVAKLIS